MFRGFQIVSLVTMFIYRTAAFWPAFVKVSNTLLLTCGSEVNQTYATSWLLCQYFLPFLFEQQTQPRVSFASHRRWIFFECTVINGRLGIQILSDIAWSHWTCWCFVLLRRSSGCGNVEDSQKRVP